MKIVKLTAENVKRLTAIEVTPEGTLIKVGGANGAGKTSVLDSIAYALGGKDLVPVEPIRTGQTEAKITVDLGDLVVVRRFTREKIKDLESEGGTQYGETKSTLTVKNKEGASYPSPQAVLDKLLGKLTFDPLQFARATQKEQDETLRRLVGLDLSTFETERKAAYDRRAMHKKSLTLAIARLNELPAYANVPPHEIAVDEISNEIRLGAELQKKAEEANKLLNTLLSARNILTTGIHAREGLIEELKVRLSKETALLETDKKSLEATNNDVTTARTTFDTLKGAVPNFEDLDARLREIDITNRKVRANLAVEQQRAETERLANFVQQEDAKVTAAEKAKEDALKAVQYPVPGLGLSDVGVTFNGVPFEQASNAEQIRVSVAIGLALNPTLKVLLIRNGNGLDSKSLKAITEQAQIADAQLWMEWVAETKDGVAVMLEDGAIV